MISSGGRVKILLFLFLVFGLTGAFLADYSYAFRNPTAAPPGGGAVINLDVNAPNNSLNIGATGAITVGTWQGSAIGVSYGGTGATTATGAINALLPSQTLQSGKFLSTDGTNASWVIVPASGTVTSISAGTGISLSPNPITATGTVTNAGVVSVS